MTIEQDVVAIIAEHFGLETSDITPAKSFADFDADSLDLTEFMMALEEKFDVEIPGEKAEQLKTVKDVIDYITLVKSAK